MENFIIAFLSLFPWLEKNFTIFFDISSGKARFGGQLWINFPSRIVWLARNFQRVKMRTIIKRFKS